MANMSYCRFHNTSLDLTDCLNALDPYENEHEISKEEVRAGENMFRNFLDYCVDNEIIEEYNREQITKVFEDRNAIVCENQEEA